MTMLPPETTPEWTAEDERTLAQIADRVDALDPRRTVLEYELYALCDPDILLGEDGVMDLERVFGIDAEVWRRTEALCREHRDRISPLGKIVRDWYGLDDAPFTATRPGPSTPSAASVPNTGTALSEEDRTLIGLCRSEYLEALIDRLSAAPSRGSAPSAVEAGRDGL